MVRIAIISDVHGNTPALCAVLSAVDAAGPDAVVNLGDIASGGLDPGGTVAELRRRPGIHTVRGNHELQVLAPAHTHGPSDRLAHEQLTAQDKGWFNDLPQRVEVVPDVLAFHGSPDDEWTYLLETVTPEGFRQATDDEVVQRLGDQYGQYRVFLCGHTHVPRMRTLPDGSLVVNPGSVGLPAYEDDRPFPHKVEMGSPVARFAIIEQDDGGRWSATQHGVDYDVSTAVELARHNGRADVERAITTGRV